jgi:hypothetical protein
MLRYIRLFLTLFLPNRWIIDEWESARSTFLESLGHRAHNWTAHAITEPNQSLVEYNPHSFDSVTSPRLGAASSSGTPGYSFGSSSISTAVAKAERPELPILVQTNANVVRKMNTANRAHIDSADKASRSPSKDIRPATLFLNALSEADANAKILSSADEIGYRSILELLQYMTHETGGIDELSPAGFYSSICFESALVDDKTRQQRKIHLTRGARHFFEKQIAKHWFHQVDYDLMQTTNSTGAGGHSLGRREESGSIPKLLARYVDSYFSRNHKEHLRERCRFTSNRTQAAANIPIWCYIYHCLRSGNLNLAIDELSNYLGSSNPSSTSTATTDGRDSIYFVLECISKRLQNISIDLDRLFKAMEYIS